MIFDFIRLWKSAKIKAEKRELRPYGRTTVYDRITIGELFDEHFVFPSVPFHRFSKLSSLVGMEFVIIVFHVFLFGPVRLYCI